MAVEMTAALRRGPRLQGCRGRSGIIDGRRRRHGRNRESGWPVHQKGWQRQIREGRLRKRPILATGGTAPWGGRNKRTMDGRHWGSSDPDYRQTIGGADEAMGGDRKLAQGRGGGVVLQGVRKEGARKDRHQKRK